MEIYHQGGHNTVWNFESYREDEVGDGIIIGPRYFPKARTISEVKSEPNCHLFDPQFFIPSCSRGKLSTFDFFPSSMVDEFDTQEYDMNHAKESAGKCSEFQLVNKFRYVVIPCRYITGFPENLINQQYDLYLDHFLNALSDYSNKPPVLLQVLLNTEVLQNDSFYHEFLTWLTGLSGIDGVYLILEDNRTDKQIKAPGILLKILQFIHKIRSNDLLLIHGYSNTESMLLSLADPNGITIGSYEAQRKFDISKFEEDDGSGARGPKPRIFIPALCQWIEEDYIDTLRVGCKDAYNLIPQNTYNVTLFDANYNWHFTKPELYKHYFIEYQKIMDQISAFEGKERFQFIDNHLRNAIREFSNIDSCGIILDRNSDDSHLTHWVNAATLFANEQGWR